MEKIEPTEKEIESLFFAFKRASHLLASGKGGWKVTQKARTAMREAVEEHEAFNLKYFSRNRTKNI